MYNEFQNSYKFGPGMRYSIVRLYDCVHLITFSSIGECSDEIIKFLMAKAIGAILIADRLCDAVPLENYVIDFKQELPTNVDSLVLAFTLNFKHLDDVADYIEELRISKIIL